jgi:hypothetical protein
MEVIYLIFGSIGFSLWMALISKIFPKEFKIDAVRVSILFAASLLLLISGFVSI